MSLQRMDIGYHFSKISRIEHIFQRRKIYYRDCEESKRGGDYVILAITAFHHLAPLMDHLMTGVGEDLPTLLTLLGNLCTHKGIV